MKWDFMLKDNRKWSFHASWYDGAECNCCMNDKSQFENWYDESSNKKSTKIIQAQKGLNFRKFWNHSFNNNHLDK
jgi:hypothetical protein